MKAKERQTAIDPKKLRTHRRRLDVRQRDLAALARCSQSLISLIERGKTVPLDHTTERICDSLNIQLKDLQK